jgi:sugar phosphate isomerase/epimerase
MSRYSRRDFCKTAAAAGSLAVPASWSSLWAAAKPNSRFGGVQIGIQSYSFRDRPLDKAIAAILECGVNSCELWQGHIEPPLKGKGQDAREGLRQWRLTTPLDLFQQVGEKFKKAGIKLFAYSYGLREDYTDQEIERGFLMAQALGARALTASSNVSTVRRVDPFAQKYKVRVGMHNHSDIRPNEFATPDDFAAAMKGMSPYIGVNLDIGHFLAAGFDPVAYLRENHDKIVCLHLKDRKKTGENLAFGEGDTPIREVLRLMKSKKWNFPANIEYEYKAQDAVVEVKKSVAFCKQALV